MTVSELKKTIQDCGVVGAGGAGFPTHLKIDPRAKTILLNCAECEPLISVDRYLLTNYANEILSALKQLSDVLDADVVVAVKKTYKNAIGSVKGIIDAYPRFRLGLLDAVYPVGDEVLLVHETLGLIVPPGALPIDIGCVVFNVETMYNIYNAMEFGRAVAVKWVTIAGEVENPGVKRISIGTAIGDAVATAGSLTVENPVYIINGLMMGIKASDADNITKTTNAIFVLPSHFFAKHTCESHGIDLKRAASACCQCRSCTDMCPRHLIGYPIEPHRIMRALCAKDPASDSFYGVMYCSSCGVCEKIACPQNLKPRSLIVIFKEELKKAGVSSDKPGASSVSPMLRYRRVDANRLLIRLGLAKYEVPV